MSRQEFTRRSRHARRALLSIAVAALVPLTPAHAQFGKLIKKAAEAAAQGKAKDAATNATGETAANANRSTTLVAITSQSIDQLLVALGPQVAAASKYAAASAAYEAQEARYRRHTACRDTIKRANSNATMIPSQAQLEKNVEYGNRVAKIMERYAAAQQAGNASAARQMLDSAGALGEVMENNLLPALKKCGAYVAQPGDKPQPPAASELGGAAPIPEGMNATQFGLLRERIAAWLVTDGQYRVKPEEQSALEARKADLAKLTPLFRGHALQWTSWSDLSSGSR